MDMDLTKEDLWVEELMRCIEDQTLMADDSDPFDHLRAHMTQPQFENIIRCAVIARRAVNPQTLFSCIGIAANTVREAAQAAAEQMQGAQQ